MYVTEFQVDGGEITEKEFLPVKQLRFGDTGSHLDEKEGRYTLGPLLCEGDGRYFPAYSVILFFGDSVLPALSRIAHWMTACRLPQIRSFGCWILAHSFHMP